MISIFNRAVLLQDSNAEAAAKAQGALKKAGIPYKVKHGGSGAKTPLVRVARSGRTGTMGAGFTNGVYMAGGVPNSWSEGGAGTTCYTVYVAKRDLKRAKAICSLK